MINSVLVFIVKKHADGGPEVCLGKRKTNYAHGMWNAPGGKVKSKENMLDAAVREVKEETGLKINKKNLIQRARITYYEPSGNCVVNVFISEVWEGDLIESDEIEPRWFNVDELPYEKMWENDKLWLPDVLSGKYIKGKIWHDKNYKVIKSELKKY